MRNIIIGTAGHVDHGKTQLIKALSGIDTDRLEEERKRGITIELGFAHIPNDAGYNIGVIDVPGHERFIRNMLAGIGGIDFVLFVVAADEGIMPQTREHFEILKALGIDDGIIAVTKTDMVDEEWLEMLVEDVTDYFRGSFLDGKPLICCSGKTMENIGVLKGEIIKKCEREVKRSESPEAFRLPVDRVFTMQGFGTVVTGTLVEGVCDVNEEISIYPRGTRAKIRGIQTYGNDVERAFAGQRTAVNLAGIKKDEVKRGDVLAAAGAVTVTNMIDVRLDVFKSSERTVLNNSRVHLYQGSREVICKVILLDRDSLGAGESSYAQLRLEEPAAVRRGDRFIIRFYSPIVTVGGGAILDAAPDKHKRGRGEVLAGLELMESRNIPDIIKFKTGGRRLYKAEELAAELGLDLKKTAAAVDGLVDAGEVARLSDGTVVSSARLEGLTGGLRTIIEAYHREKPLADGIPKQELLSRLKGRWFIENDRTIGALVTYFSENGIIGDRGKSFALAGFEVEYTEAQQALKLRIEEMYAAAGIEMIRTDDIYALDRDRNVIAAMLGELTEAGKIVKVDSQYYVSSESWNAAVREAVSLGADGASFTLADYRDALGTSRKYAGALLQAMDRQGITQFVGDARVVPTLKR